MLLKYLFVPMDKNSASHNREAKYVRTDVDILLKFIWKTGFPVVRKIGFPLFWYCLHWNNILIHVQLEIILKEKNLFEI